MRMPMSGNTFFKSAGEQIQRKCSCSKENEKLQKKEDIGNSNHAVSHSFVQDSLGSVSNSLDAGTRGFMESRFGYDFGNVQVHDDWQSHHSTKNLNALAYTHGNHIAFASGKYRPQIDEGKKLLAHELTHVVQQNGQTPTLQKKEESHDNYDATKGWEYDMESFSKVAAEHYMRNDRGDFFDLIESIQCNAESTLGHECDLTTKAGKKLYVWWLTDTKRVIVRGVKNDMNYTCGYEYTSVPSQPVVFRKTRCWYG